MDFHEPSHAAPAAAPIGSDLRERLRLRKAVAGRVSVIVPVFQGERYILGAVRSALAQTHRDVEVLVVDDGSTDATAARLARIADPRLTVLQQANQGTAAARNLALAQASGEYIAFLDADDRWFPKKLEIEIATLRTSADPVGIAYSWYYAVDDDGKLLQRSRAHSLTGQVFELMLGMDNFIIPSVSLFHRGVFEEIGGFDSRSLHEDYVLVLKATKRFPVYPTRRYLAAYRQSTEGKCRHMLRDFERSRDAQLAVVAELRPQLSNEQADRLLAQQNRALYFRFLMYGFDEHATRLLPDVDVASLRHGVKGWIAWLHAKSGVNAMQPLRIAVQGVIGGFGQRAWREELSREGLGQAYSSE